MNTEATANDAILAVYLWYKCMNRFSIQQYTKEKKKYLLTC